MSPERADAPTLNDLLGAEADRFRAEHPRSVAMAAQAASVWRGGAPLHWMNDWASPTPIFAAQGVGAQITDVDGRLYDDFCLGDTPSMFGHGDASVAAAVADQIRRGAGFMLPTATSVMVGRLLAERFGLPLWQVATTASDANRAVIRWARAVTGRPVILVFDGCYHGMVEDAFVVLKDGAGVMKPGLVGQVHDLTATTRVVPFNDLAALEAALAPGDVAAVLAEPVMTNCGMILPDEGFHDALRSLTRAAGTLLILDETHTLSSGPGGYTRLHDLQPDLFVVGKAIAGGVPAAVWGVTAELSAQMDAAQAQIGPGQSGIGTTLSGNALAMAAMRAMLTEVMTDAAYDRMLAGAERLVAGLRGVISARGLPWSVAHVGARVELVFVNPPPKNAAQMRKALDHELLAALHLWLINRGVLIAPFHNMMLVSPVTEDASIDRLVAAVDGFAGALEGLTA
ncbi:MULTISPECIES: aspartate aminotransferase family protein [unclassified Caulobacter]|uniref:aspartate aminotransferase family protein n=1 Tax=unclassified Caulobacter TaxID=2648921 RepID=UPI000D364368|nr:MULTISPECIES: aspartate aminotransferase family protein [unclassified Caulobacter]PTS87529.1 aspartate aminotransferase family protein [Caulobacter sp. HMWF009]PTT05614.1 aspartate aminotransferase family protein [Caulobacter sp. HMWF025]